MKTWNEGKLDNSISKVFKRARPVLCNILQAKGGNDLVETKRGKTHEGIKIEDIILQMEKEGDDTNNNSLEKILVLDNDDNLDGVLFEEDII